MWNSCRPGTPQSLYSYLLQIYKIYFNYCKFFDVLFLAGFSSLRQSANQICGHLREKKKTNISR